MDRGEGPFAAGPEKLVDVLTHYELERMEGATPTKSDKRIVRVTADTDNRIGDLRPGRCSA